MALARTDTSPLFGSGATSTLRLIVYLSACVALMVADHRGQYLAQLRQYLHLMIEPVYHAAALPADAARAVRKAVADRSALTEENQRLREALLLTQARLNRLDSVAEQNTRLKELLEVQHSVGMGVQLAKLVDIVLDPYRQRIMLDVGANQGVVLGQAVLDAYGVMGQISEVLPNTATAILITDPTHAIPVTVDRTGLRTVAYGSGSSDRLDIPNIPLSADIKPGDKLVTSGLGGRFPAGFPVAEITSVGTDSSGMFAAAVARPSAALERSGEVLLLRPLTDPVGPPALVDPGGPPAPPPEEATVTADAKVPPP
ncbi:rod shape-determining protein MreC [Tahibacter amnicola]|uniref:Cell shape-determining protein MreC n=1 Tax=Tahibacter amnicola TaxID=2976241 RepID=A0ABY6BE21_9GAMM|nr:rod shape-determining protein MreC [Tahibacter amnicola]UXI68004.1 rod shape-determining protein MreC [Tahibacter amnicola]